MKKKPLKKIALAGVCRNCKLSEKRHKGTYFGELVCPETFLPSHTQVMLELRRDSKTTVVPDWDDISWNPMDNLELLEHVKKPRRRNKKSA